MSQPVISVITVVYNGVATLEKTLQSVFSQTWPQIDYVLVDGGSTDGTLQVIDQYKSRLGAFVSEPDKGIYDAMNKGIRLTKGDYIFFLGSDDVLHDEKVFAGIFGDTQNLQFDLIYGNVISPSYKRWYDGAFTFAKLLNRNISHQAIFYKRTVFQRIGDYNLRYSMHADWDLNIRCFKDPSVRTKYVPLLVADFGAGGVSAGHDVHFLQDVLIREKLLLLNHSGSKTVRSLKAYDEWWRLLRNAQLNAEDALERNTGGLTIPLQIRRMIRLQRRIPWSLLRIGFFSKAVMILHYISNLFSYGPECHHRQL